jgi:type IV pilus assembly protein PilB
MLKSQKKLGEILIAQGHITGEELEGVLKRQRVTKEYLGTMLLRDKIISERQLLEALSEQYGMPLVNLKHRYLDWDLIKSFSASLILDYQCFPLSQASGVVTMAITNPLDVWVIKRAEEETRGLRLKLVLVAKDDMRGAIKRYREYIQKNIANMFRKKV